MTKATNAQLPIIDDFMSYLLDERHFSPYTSRCYGVDLRQYAEFLTDELNITADRQQEAQALERAALRKAGHGAPSQDVVATLAPATITEAMLKMDVNGYALVALYQLADQLHSLLIPVTQGLVRRQVTSAFLQKT